MTLRYHAVHSTEDAPVSCQEAILGDLSEAQRLDSITPGTEIHARWKSPLDMITYFLQQRQ